MTIRLEKDVLTLHVGPVTARVRALTPAADWPTMPPVDGDAVHIGDAALAKLIDSVRFAISTEETRYFLHGIYLTAIDGKLAGVATDGHRLARYCSSEDWPWPSVIFPRKAVATLRSRLVPGGNRTVAVAVKVKHPMADTILPAVHRGIVIRQAKVPGAPFEWTHEEADAHGMAPTLDGAIRQVNVHLGSADPDCRICRGTRAHLAMTPCRLCNPEDAV